MTRGTYQSGIGLPARGTVLALSLAVFVGVLVAVTALPAAQGQVGTGCGGPEPEPTVSPTEPSPTPTEPSPTPTGDPAGRVVTLSASKAMVKALESVDLKGTVGSADGECLPDVKVKISGETLGSGEACGAKGGTTNEDGEFTGTAKVLASCEFTAVAPETKDGEPEAVSEPVTVLAKVYVLARTRNLTPERGSKVEITAQVKPPHPGSFAKLERKKKDGAWRRVLRDKANADGFKFKLLAKWKKKRVFRVTWIKSDEDHEAASSNRLKIKTRAPHDNGGRGRRG